jgi:hypothetical protein
MKILSLRMPAPGLLVLVPLLLMACALFGSEEEPAVPEVTPTEQATVEQPTATSEPTAEPTATMEEPTATVEPSPTPEEPTPTATVEQGGVPAQATAVLPAATSVTVPTIMAGQYPGLAVAAEQLGVSEAELLAAINQPSSTLSTVAQTLGVDELVLRLALEAAGVPLPQ